MARYTVTVLDRRFEANMSSKNLNHRWFGPSEWAGKIATSQLMRLWQSGNDYVQPNFE